MTTKPQTIEEILADARIEPYTREQFDVDYTRVMARLAAKHGIPQAEIPQLIREHRYTHSAEDPEDEYIKLMAIARCMGWPT